MSLVSYKEKRNFKSTSEPSGGKVKGGRLIFVVQKHAASRLHYDFRLEMDGVLKSWAVPKGPSADPAVKRLAMKVEDHPYDYKDFEGTIPKGNYGAGAVIIWDEGTYEPIEKMAGRKVQEKYLLKQLKEGSLKVVLHGKKLKGEWALVHTRQSENSWLLIKHRDQFATETDITKKSKSVVTGKTIEQIEKTMVSENGSAKNAVRKVSLKKTALKRSSTTKPKSSSPGKKKVIS